MILRDVPPLRTLPKTIEAACYNRARLSLLRFGDPLHVELPRLGLDMTLDRKIWLALSLWQEDLPMLAWTDFDGRRAALHEPVHCQLKLYHMHAGLLMGPALDTLDKHLYERLRAVRRAPAGG